MYKLCSFSASVELYTFGDRLNLVSRSENSHWNKSLSLSLVYIHLGDSRVR